LNEREPIRFSGKINQMDQRIVQMNSKDEERIQFSPSLKSGNLLKKRRK